MKDLHAPSLDQQPEDAGADPVSESRLRIAFESPTPNPGGSRERPGSVGGDRLPSGS